MSHKIYFASSSGEPYSLDIMESKSVLWTSGIMVCLLCPPLAAVMSRDIDGAKISVPFSGTDELLVII